MTPAIFCLLAIALPFLFPPTDAESAILTTDTVWKNEQTISEDILVPPGITLTIKAGTNIRVSPAETTKTDPEFMSPLTEITVRGKIVIEGNEKAPVSIAPSDTEKKGEWAGILLDGGAAQITHCTISGADSALYSMNGNIAATGLRLSGNRYGVTLIGSKGKSVLRGSRISGNDYGIVTLSASEPDLAGTSVSGNGKKDFRKEELPPAVEPQEKKASSAAVTRIFGDEALVGDTVWRGRIRINGNLRVPEGSRLVITPGTIIEFFRKDTNGDAIGENGILIQGSLVAKGTKSAPILFRSAENDARPGDWDSVNIMNSDKAENLVEHCIFEDAYRGLHFHYSTVLVSESSFRNNYRAIQFQESDAEIRNSEFIANKSGVQGRDSSIIFRGNSLFDNHQGVNFFRSDLMFHGNRITGSWKDGVRIREGNATISENLVQGNRFGMMIADTYYGSINGNVIANSGETGLSMRSVDNLEVTGNYLGRNGSNGLNLQDARAAVTGNLIVANGERGIGVISFSGTINGNNITGNRLYAIDLEGEEDLDATANWWGGDDPATVVFDRRRDPVRGRVLAGTPSAAPVPFSWPLQRMDGGITLSGEVLLSGHPLAGPDSVLTVTPGTTVRFTPGSGLIIRGKLQAEGTPQRPIRFTSLSDQTQGAWDEIILEQATDSTISHAIIEYATWGIHGHFTNLLLDHVVARKNGGGMRFRSGPVTVRQSVFRDNGIGIRAYMGNALIEENIITGNETGLFVRERGGGLVVRKNNFFANSDYNIRSGDFNTEDIRAEENWWGTLEPLTTIFDGRQEEGIGKVLLEPYLSEPVPLEKAGVP